MRISLPPLAALVVVALIPSTAQAKWVQVKGPVLTATFPWEGVAESRPAVSEPTVIWDKDRYRLWYSSGWETMALGYAESRDGIHWTKRPTQVLDDATHSNVVKTSKGFQAYVVGGGGTRLDIAYLKPDGVTVYGRRTVMRTVPGSITARGIANTFAWRTPAGSWRLLYEGFGPDRVWRTALASAGNPGWGWLPGRTLKIGFTKGMFGGPWLDGNCLYFHASRNNTNLPTRIYRRCGPSLDHLGRMELMVDMEQRSWQYDQVADPSIARRPGHRALMLFDGVNNIAATAAIGAAWEIR